MQICSHLIHLQGGHISEGAQLVLDISMSWWRVSRDKVDQRIRLRGNRRKLPHRYQSRKNPNLNPARKPDSFY